METKALCLIIGLIFGSLSHHSTTHSIISCLPCACKLKTTKYCFLRRNQAGLAEGDGPTNPSHCLPQTDQWEARKCSASINDVTLVGGKEAIILQGTADEGNNYNGREGEWAP